MDKESTNGTGEHFGNRESAVDVIRRRAADCRSMASTYDKKAKQLDRLASKLIEIERDARRPGGNESGPHIGNGSDAEQALWMLAVDFRVGDFNYTTINHH